MHGLVLFHRYYFPFGVILVVRMFYWRSAVDLYDFLDRTVQERFWLIPLSSDISTNPFLRCCWLGQDSVGSMTDTWHDG